MAASFMNPHRAIDYLFNPSLMPAVPRAAPPAAEAAPAPTPPTEGTGGTQPATEGTTPSAGAGNLDFLRNQPQVGVIKQLFRIIRCSVSEQKNRFESIFSHSLIC